MTHFPVLDSILAIQDIAQFVGEHYQLPTAQGKILRTGINHSYLITSKEDKFVFRVYSYQWRSSAEILEEIRLINQLKAAGMSVSYPILDKQKQYIQEINAPEGLRYGVLFSFAEGKKIRNLTVEHSHQIGVQMARMHQATADQSIDRVTYDANALTQIPYQRAKAHFAESLEEMQFVKQAGKAIKLLFDKCDADKLRSGVVHLDMWYDNMHVDESAHVTLFDFDFCGNGWLLLDVAYAVMQIFHTEPDKEKFEAKLKHFYAGYEQLIPLSPEEKALLPMAGLSIWIFYLGVQSQRHDNWSNIFLSENYLKRYLDMVKSWLSYNEIDPATWPS
jgi:Ser/Thr protein kinase RdoA (MazF antagonist)